MAHHHKSSSKHKKNSNHKNSRSVNPPSEQSTQNQLENSQVQFQGLVVRKSHTVVVAQVEAQALILIQAALQAAIEAAIIVFGNEDKDIKQLQNVAQSLKNLQIQQQSVLIEESDGITVTQVELQFEAVIQAAIQLLAQLMLKIG